MLTKWRIAVLLIALFAAACGGNPPGRESQSTMPEDNVTPEPVEPGGNKIATPTPTPGPDANLKRIMFTAATEVSLVSDGYTAFRDIDAIVGEFGGIKPRRCYLQIIQHKNNTMVSIAYFEFIGSREANDAALNSTLSHEGEKSYIKAFACFNYAIKITSIDEQLAQEAADQIARKAGVPPVRLVEASAPPNGEKDLSKASPKLVAALNKIIGTYSTAGGDLANCLDFMAGAMNNHPDNQYRIEFEFAPDVKGSVSGKYAGKTRREILDDMCRQTGCDWEVAGPTLITIKKRD